jgi:WxL domain surface cell wall-binding
MIGWMTIARRITLPMAAFVLAMMVMCGVAYGSATTHVVFTAGPSLQITDPTVGDFGGIRLDGAAKQATAAMTSVRVTDPRGTGKGWHVTVQASQFTDRATRNTLPLGSLYMAAPNVAQHDWTSSAPPALQDGSYFIDHGSAVQIASAAVGDGMGSYDFTPSAGLTLCVGADARPGAYVSTVTLSVVSGP